MFFIKSLRHITFIATVAMMLVLSQACKKNYLGVSDQLTNEITLETVFSNPGLTRQFYTNIFSGITNSSNMIFDPNYTIDGLDNPWAGLSDELKIGQGALNNQVLNGYNSANAPYHRWTILYQLIRQANIFMDMAKELPIGDNTNLNAPISAAEMTQMKSVARFFRAYYHYLLFEQYGPIPIADKVSDPSSQSLDFARNSVDEVVNFIKSELEAAAPGLEDVSTLPNTRVVPTKAVALAVKAKLMVYAASPLYNGGYQEALQITNPDGKKIFPAADPSKWTSAKSAVEEFINFANGKYSLYKRFKADGSYDPDLSLYQLFFDVDNNKEVIWASSVNDWGNVGSDGTERRITPRTVFGGFSSIGVLQELVDAFFMIDGKSIKESPLYSEDKFSVAGDDLSGRTEPGTYYMYVNREPRFYQTVFYQGRKWHINNQVIKFHAGSGNDQSSTNNSYVGNLLYKRAARNVLNSGNNPRIQYRPAIIFRLADFYLLYAEALNEVNPADPKILEYIDMVRERAGIPKLSVLKPGILGNKELLREAIIAERRVELCTEGQRYFDVRRWMIAERLDEQGGGHQGGGFHGMDMLSSSETIGGFFKRRQFEVRPFVKAMYLYPIPQAEILKSRDRILIQNPGWE